MSRRRPCDGCGADRKRWQRLCDTCYAQLPGNVRTGLVTAHRQKRMADWRRWVAQAKQLLRASTAGHPGTISPSAAYERNMALLGERDR